MVLSVATLLAIEFAIVVLFAVTVALVVARVVLVRLMEFVSVVLFAAAVAWVAVKLVFVVAIELFKVAALLAIDFVKTVVFAATVVFVELRFVFKFEIFEFIAAKSDCRLATSDISIFRTLLIACAMVVIELFKVATPPAIARVKAVLLAATVVFVELRFVFMVEILEFIAVRLL